MFMIYVVCPGGCEPRYRRTRVALRGIHRRKCTVVHMKIYPRPLDPVQICERMELDERRRDS